MRKYNDQKIVDKIIELIPPESREIIKAIKYSFLTVDYTSPNAVNLNGDFYCENELPFVMGTTGGDKELLKSRIETSNISAVIAPNMAKQIVAFQSMMQYLSETFPKAFENYTLEIIESHQQNKIDTSGTAEEMVNYFNKLGIPFTINQIQMIRTPSEQLKLGVPPEFLNGHAWHRYKLKSPKHDVIFEFVHNINGRNVYVDGTIDALIFLNKKKVKGKVFSMIDVLKDS